MKSIQVEVKNVLATVSEAEIKALDAEVAGAQFDDVEAHHLAVLVDEGAAGVAGPGGVRF